MTQQLEALRLADLLEQPDDSLRWADGNNLIPQAAAELRRLHTVNAQLLEALDYLAAWYDGDVGPHMDEPQAAAVARSAIRAAKEQT